MANTPGQRRPWLPGRWGRALWLLPPPPLRLLDLGCAFGFLTGRLITTDRVVGVEPLWRYLAQARAAYPTLAVVHATGERLPFKNASFDAVLMLDVLEHVTSESATLAEVARVLAPGGTLIVSVPHQGWLASLDAQNLYDSLRSRVVALPHRADERSYHRHYSVADVSTLLSPHFEVLDARRSGLGLAELINFFLLVIVYGAARLPGLFRRLQFAYFTAYLIEDLLPTGPAGYHLMVQARRSSSLA